MAAQIARSMREFRLTLLLVFSVASVFGQVTPPADAYRLPKHFLSISPLNLLLAQQAGITYEFRPGRFGFALGTGYMYRNNSTWSDFFYAGPVPQGQLGYYAGVYAIPQVNFYFKPKMLPEGAVLFYVGLRGVYRHMSVDSVGYVPWKYSEDAETYSCYKMVDRVNIYAAYVNVGMKVLRRHFFFDLSVGYGFLSLYHDMYIASHQIRNHVGPVYSPPKHEKFFDQHQAFNFNLSFGGVF